MIYRTNKELKMDAWGVMITLPKGTRIIEVKGAGGGMAVADVAMLKRLTGNTHDPVYRYLWIDKRDMEDA